MEVVLHVADLDLVALVDGVPGVLGLVGNRTCTPALASSAVVL